MYRIVIYSPDRHILYEPAIADRDGIGGGLTARLRLAQALAGHNCQVTLVANLKQRRSEGGVEYIPLGETRDLKGDLVIFNTTGSEFDLRSTLNLSIHTRLRLVWVNNTTCIQGLGELEWDYIVAPSIFVRQVAVHEWRIPENKIFVIHNGVPEDPHFFFGPKRDPFRLVYSSHPSKGLTAAVKVLQLLRQRDKRFELHVFGGNRLWGEDDKLSEFPEGVVWRGMVGQKVLAKELRKATFAIHLQGFEEAFGIAMAEAMAAGCVVIASRKGAFNERIREGFNGFLLDGLHESAETAEAAARLVLRLTADSTFRESIRDHAMATPLRWPVVARSWVELCDQMLA